MQKDWLWLNRFLMKENALLSRYIFQTYWLLPPSIKTGAPLEKVLVIICLTVISQLMAMQINLILNSHKGLF